MSAPSDAPLERETLMDHILFVDTETTGTEDTDAAIEVAATIFSVKHACAVRSFASLIRAQANTAEKINGISPAVLLDAPEPAPVWARVREMAGKCDAIVAHNAEFDARFVPPEVTGTKPWICTMEDLLFPRQTKQGMNLRDLALAHKVGVVTAHRATADVDILVRLFERVAELGVDLDVMLARGLRPKSLYRAHVSFDDKDLAKDAGFKWEPTTKRWLRRMADADVAELGFRAVAVQP
jgi:DNA polymerase-3 subunit epsilon